MSTQEGWSSAEDAHAYKKVHVLVDQWRALGCKSYPDGTEWIGHTPHRAPEAYLHQLYAPLDDVRINQLEIELLNRIPDSFRCFLTLHNGIGLFANYINVYGLRTSWSRTNLLEAAQQPFSILVPNVKRRPLNAPDDVIFLGSLGKNRQLVGARPDGGVFLWEGDDTFPILSKSYSSVFAFLLEEATNAATLFGPDGRRRDSDS